MLNRLPPFNSSHVQLTSGGHHDKPLYWSRLQKRVEEKMTEKFVEDLLQPCRPSFDLKTQQSACQSQNDADFAQFVQEVLSRIVPTTLKQQETPILLSKL